jgi:hypothetical protein
VTQTTPTLALVKPGGGSTGLNTPPDRVDIDVLNGNADKIDAFAAGVGLPAARSTQFYGLAANIGSVTPKVGDEYQESDGDKRRWRYNGATWQHGSSGLIALRPLLTDLVGLKIEADGRLTPSGAAVKSVSVNNCFNSGFFDYEIHCFTYISGADLQGLRLRAGGVDLGAGVYADTAISVNSAGTLAGSFTAAFNYWPLGATNSVQQNSVIQLLNPSGTQSGRIKMYQATVTTASGGASHVTRGGHLPGYDSTSYDGFTILNLGGSANMDQNASWFKIYARA